MHKIIKFIRSKLIMEIEKKIYKKIKLVILVLSY